MIIFIIVLNFFTYILCISWYQSGMLRLMHIRTSRVNDQYYDFVAWCILVTKYPLLGFDFLPTYQAAAFRIIMLPLSWPQPIGNWDNSWWFLLWFWCGVTFPYKPVTKWAFESHIWVPCVELYVTLPAA